MPLVLTFILVVVCLIASTIDDDPSTWFDDEDISTGTPLPAITAR